MEVKKFQKDINKISKGSYSKYRKNTINRGQDYKELIKEFDNISDILSHSFVWGRTIEGIQFWSDIASYSRN